MKPISSVITTFPRAAASSIGTGPGSPGLATSENSNQVVDWLASCNPADVDKAAVLRASQLGVELTLKVDVRFPKDEHGNSMAVVKLVRGCDVTGTLESRRLTSETLIKLMVPADKRQIEGWLSELDVIVTRRRDDEFTEALRMDVYTSRLCRYPADVARAALLERTWKFWPTWAELEIECDQLVAPRRMMISALKHSDHGQAREFRERVSSERAAEIIREVYGR